MPPKRPLESGTEPTTSTQFKRVKLQQARDIAVQPVAGPSSLNAAASGQSVSINSRVLSLLQSHEELTLIIQA